MLGTLSSKIRKWVEGQASSRPVPASGAGVRDVRPPPDPAAGTSARNPRSQENGPAREGAPAPGQTVEKEPKRGPPPTLPPGLTLREHLNEGIRNRSRWLDGRYGRDGEDSDQTALLRSLLAPVSSVIRRPPLAARRLLQENRRDTASLTAMAEIIEGDPALLQAVLKHANSAFYATAVGGNPILSVNTALQRIGSRGIEIVVMSHLVEGSLCRPGEGLDDLAGTIWGHMLRVGPMARVLAPGFGVHPDEAYAIGLLHDVGKLVLFNRVADLRKHLRRPLRFRPGFVKAALRELHQPLGGLAILEWGMGEAASLAVAHHHRNPPVHPPMKLEEVVFLAEKLDILMGKGVNPELGPIWMEGELTASLDEVSSIWEPHRSGFWEARREEDEASAGSPEMSTRGGGDGLDPGAVRAASA